MNIRSTAVWTTIIILCAAFWLAVGCALVAHATQFGSSNTDDLPFRPDVERVFMQAPDNWNKVNGPSSVSFKLDPAKVASGKYDTMLRNWFKSAPKYKIWYTFWHEPENDLTTKAEQAAYRKAWPHIVRIERATGPNRLYATTLFMNYTLRTPTRQLSWWYPGDKWVDVLGFDGYLTKPDKRYIDPATTYGPMLKVARAHGKPLAIGEWGSPVFGGDTQGRARWITKTGAWFKSHNVTFACYWNQNSTPARGDMRLLDVPSRNALKGLMR